MRGSREKAGPPNPASTQQGRMLSGKMGQWEGWGGKAVLQGWAKSRWKQSPEARSQNTEGLAEEGESARTG